jgi:hypothetical protein
MLAYRPCRRATLPQPAIILLNPKPYKFANGACDKLTVGFASKKWSIAGANFISEINNRDLAQVVVRHEQKEPKDVRVPWNWMSHLDHSGLTRASCFIMAICLVLSKVRNKCRQEPRVPTWVILWWCPRLI